MTLAQEMTLLGQKAKEAARLLAKASPAAKNAALTRLAALLEEREAELRTANAQDLDAARARGLDAPRMDRLTLHPAVLPDMRAACLHVAGLPDPVGAMDSQWQRPNGLLVGRMRVPLGVVLGRGAGFGQQAGGFLGLCLLYTSQVRQLACCQDPGRPDFLGDG